MTDNTAIYGAFMLEGMRDAAERMGGPQGYEKLLIAWGNGCLELVTELCQYASYFDEAIKPYVDQDYGFPGVYEYEVVNFFGSWFAEYVYGAGYVPPVMEAKGEIDRLTTDFFRQ